MRTYCFKCPRCGLRSQAGDRDERICGPCFLDEHTITLVRDYQSESVGFNGLAEMKKQREQGLDGLSGRKEQRDLFLPTAEELAGPGDRSGQKAIREWAEKHTPKDDNKKPLYPEMEKRTF